MRAAVTAFTGRGSRLAAKLLEALHAAGWEASAWIPEKYMDESLASAGCLANPLALSDWMEARMREETGAFVFVGACGIAVRVVAPWVNHKSTDHSVKNEPIIESLADKRNKISDCVRGDLRV